MVSKDDWLSHWAFFRHRLCRLGCRMDHYVLLCLMTCNMQCAAVVNCMRDQCLGKLGASLLELEVLHLSTYMEELR